MTAPVPGPCPAVRAAERLRHALTRHGIAVDVHGGYGLALVSVWAGLVVWSNGDRLWWCEGWDTRWHRPIYASHRASEPEQAADRVARYYARLRAQHPYPHPPQPLRADPI